jgi:hypothetical protein
MLPLERHYTNRPALRHSRTIPCIELAVQGPCELEAPLMSDVNVALDSAIYAFVVIESFPDLKQISRSHIKSVAICSDSGPAMSIEGTGNERTLRFCVHSIPFRRLAQGLVVNTFAELAFEEIRLNVRDKERLEFALGMPTVAESQARFIFRHAFSAVVFDSRKHLSPVLGDIDGAGLNTVIDMIIDFCDMRWA